jgi:hypothetical protein
MSMDRRSLIKGMATCGIAAPFLAGTLFSSTNVLAHPSASVRPLRVLLSSTDHDSAFALGVLAGTGRTALPLQSAQPTLAFLRIVDEELRSGASTRIIGLLDDATATPLLAIARSHGVDMSWLAQHTATGTGRTRHRVLTTAAACECARQFARQMHACGDGMLLHEERSGEPVSPRQLDLPQHGSVAQADQWAASIGYLLATHGLRPLAKPPRLPAGRPPLVGSFVSFLMDLGRSHPHG